VVGVSSLVSSAFVVWLAELRSVVLGCRQVLVLAIVLRALMLPMPPRLSGDMYRYLWDGVVQIEGENPFTKSQNCKRASMQLHSTHK